MSDHSPSQTDPGSDSIEERDGTAQAALEHRVEGEVVSAPVAVEVRALPVAPLPVPSVRTAAAAAGGFLAGAVTLALLHRRDARRLAQALGRPMLDPGAPLVPLSGTRSYLVDVHVVTKRPR